MSDSMKELDALLGYLIGHNKDHAEEITELAEKALALGKTRTHSELLAGVRAMNESTEHLEAALKELRG